MQLFLQVFVAIISISLSGRLPNKHILKGRIKLINIIGRQKSTIPLVLITGLVNLKT